MDRQVAVAYCLVVQIVRAFSYLFTHVDMYVDCVVRMQPMGIRKYLCMHVFMRAYELVGVR